MLAWLLLTACAPHRVALTFDPGEGTVPQVGEVLEERLHEVGARRYKVHSDDELVVWLRPEDRPRLDAVLVSGVLSVGWEGEEPFLPAVVAKELTCIETTGRVRWALSFRSDDAFALYEQTFEPTTRTLQILVDGEVVSEAAVREPISGGTAMVDTDMSYRDCRVLSAQLSGGVLPEGFRLVAEDEL